MSIDSSFSKNHSISSARSNVRRLKMNPNKASSISAGSIILSIGYGGGFTIHAIKSTVDQSVIIDYLVLDTIGLDRIINLFSTLFMTIFLDPIVSISGFVLSFFIGGIITAFKHGIDGKLGSKYSIRLAFSLSFGFMLIYGLLSSTNSYYGMYASATEIPELLFMLVGLSFISAVVTIPLSFFSWLGFKLGIFLGAS